eukprot:jgi/Psemu1/318615/estExt_fgenesh1_pm.C_970006
MGSVFGKETVKEPAFKTIFQRPPLAQTTYQIREYGTRFVAEVDYDGGNRNTGTPFRALARYIGVFGDAENEGSESMAMTAPVAKERKGTPMAMTAPKIPKPTNPNVKITEIPPQLGVVHRYSGSLSDQLHDEKAKALSAQLREDGIDRMTEEYVLQHYQFWGYNPPFTLPMFRRNEVWLELSKEEVEILRGKFETEAVN